MRTITALFVGLGSIGTRHLKNLFLLCEKQGVLLRADALRSDISRPLRDGVAQLLTAQVVLPISATLGQQPFAEGGDLADILPLPQYDLIFITNPTSCHAAALQLLRGRAGAFFIEKPIFDESQIALMLGDVIAPHQKAYVAAPMRWCGAMLALKAYLAAHPDVVPYSVRAICSSYLPDWRPGVDYRTVYSAHRDMGGGVTIDLIHEWDYLVDLFGKPLEMHHFKGTYSDLEIDSDDVSIYIARYATLLCELHLDYFGRGYRRTLELLTNKGNIIADFGAGTLTLPDGSVQECAEDVNERYLRELSYFMAYAMGQETESQNPPAEGLDVLRLTLGKGL